MIELLIALNATLILVFAGLPGRALSRRRGERLEGGRWTAMWSGQRCLVGVAADFLAVRAAVPRFFDPATGRYADLAFDGQMELANLTGNVATRGAKAQIHPRAALDNGRGEAIFGHQASAIVSGAGEFAFATLPDARVEKSLDDATGLNLYDFQN